MSFPDGQFGEPATDEQFASVETDLGTAIPRVLKNIYSEANGFREPIGNAAYLLPLSGNNSLVNLTKFFWNELPDIDPKTPDFSEFIFFGNSSADENWAVRVKQPHDVICYHHHMEGEFKPAESDLLQLFLRDQEMYLSPE